MACSDADICYPSLKSDSNLNTLMSDGSADFSYQLFGDTDRFELWEDWVNDSSTYPTPLYQET